MYLFGEGGVGGRSAGEFVRTRCLEEALSSALSTLELVSLNGPPVLQKNTNSL